MAMKKTKNSKCEKALLKAANKLEEKKELHRKIVQEATDILKSKNFRSTKAHMQHGDVSVNEHCKNVTATALKMSRKLHLKVNERALIRGALLHDYFLYDWHIPNELTAHKLHGFYHPGFALKNAERDFTLSDRERDIIKKHMWPMTIIPPKYLESWVVTCADKWCSMLETVHLKKGHNAV